jgi:hypothetical protein
MKNNYEVRPCTEDDVWSMQLLRLKQTRHVGGSISRFTTNLLIQVETKFLEYPHYTVGTWCDGKLVGYIVAEHVDGNAWVLNLMIGGGDAETLQMALDKCLELMEAKGITTFYYAFPQKWARLYKSFWKSGCLRLRKYTIQDVDKVSPGAIPKDTWVWENVMHKYVSPMPLLIRKSFVQNETEPAR